MDIKNTQAKRLYESLLNFTDSQTAEKIACSSKLSASPTEKKKIDWAMEICEKLEKSFDDDTVRHIRMDCCCKPSMDKLNKFKELYEMSGNLNEFAEKMNDLNHGASFWYENGSLYMSYPVCYCSFIKRSDVLLPKSWCYCTMGYTRYMFDYILGREVRVELIESIKTGGSRCVIRIADILEKAGESGNSAD